MPLDPLKQPVTVVLLAELLADWLDVELGLVVGLVCASIHVAQRSIATTNKDLLIKFFLSFEEAASDRAMKKVFPQSGIRYFQSASKPQSIRKIFRADEVGTF